MIKGKIITLILAILILLSCGGKEDGSISNAIIILIDTCRFDDVGRTTSHGPVTPNLDRFALSGAATFLRATAPAPWTLPSVASLLTAVYPTVHGAVGHYPDFSRVRENVVTVPEMLCDAGFRTCALVNVAFLDPVLGLNRGFETYDYKPGGNLKIRRAHETFGDAIRWIEEQKGAPFFLFIHLFDPHMDFDPPEPFRSRFLADYEGEMKPPFREVARWRTERKITREIRDFARALYLAEIAAVDDACGGFFTWLDSTGLAKETVVAVTADHGEEFWEHGNFEHGHSLYEELIHVPLMIRAGERKLSATVNGRVGLVDVMPTFLDLLGVAPAETFQGESLLPLMRGEAEPGPGYRFSEALLYGHEWKSVTGNEWKFSYDEVRNKMSLYNLRLDPGELDDLSGMEEKKVQEMASILLAWIRDALERTEGAMRGGEVVNMEEEVVDQLRALGYID